MNGTFNIWCTNQVLFLFPNWYSQDMSAYVKKIQFKLHESYANPLRGVQFS